MYIWLFFILELVILFVTSRSISQALFIIFYRLLKNERRAAIPVFIIFLPGVIIHELSHFLMAEILFVKAHSVNIAPKIEGGNLRMGSVEVSKTDIFRQILIGTAPVIFGITILTAGIYSFLHFIKFQELLTTPAGLLILIFLVYLVFAVTNTMFSSKKDMEGLFEFSLIIFFFGLVTVFTGIVLKIDFLKILLDLLTSQTITDAVKLICLLILAPVIINIFFVLTAKFVFKR